MTHRADTLPRESLCTLAVRSAVAGAGLMMLGPALMLGAGVAVALHLATLARRAAEPWERER